MRGVGRGLSKRELRMRCVFPSSSWSPVLTRLLLQSFSNLWIEFLLKEASSGAAGAPAPSPPLAGPLSPTSSGPPSAGAFGRFDLPSLGSPPASTSSTRRPSLSSLFSNGSSTAQTSTAPPSIKEEDAR